jgi:hypothetical protein
MFELSRNPINPLYDEKIEVIWNKLKKWGNEEDRLFRIKSREYKKSEEEWFYSGDVLKKLKIEGKGLEEIYIPEMSIENIPENQLISKESYLSIILKSN